MRLVYYVSKIIDFKRPKPRVCSDFVEPSSRFRVAVSEQSDTKFAPRDQSKATTRSTTP